MSAQQQVIVALVQPWSSRQNRWGSCESVDRHIASLGKDAHATLACRPGCVQAVAVCGLFVRHGHVAGLASREMRLWLEYFSSKKHLRAPLSRMFFGSASQIVVCQTPMKVAQTFSVASHMPTSVFMLQSHMLTKLLGTEVLAGQTKTRCLLKFRKNK